MEAFDSIRNTIEFPNMKIFCIFDMVYILILLYAKRRFAAMH